MYDNKFIFIYYKNIKNLLIKNFKKIYIYYKDKMKYVNFTINYIIILHNKKNTLLHIQIIIFNQNYIKLNLLLIINNV